METFSIRGVRPGSPAQCQLFVLEGRRIAATVAGSLEYLRSRLGSRLRRKIIAEATATDDGFLTYWSTDREDGETLREAVEKFLQKPEQRRVIARLRSRAEKIARQNDLPFCRTYLARAAA
ncbi:MAG: hypothetical protein UY63_C0012G0013 [Parcubacteria group bacterium GW2011_GWA2_51_10]|nr:MAG: hypothetical protein UY63_C0012G0013 [Parcubacteria group bacterium GW2011_GWA2_51_10]